MDTIHTIARAYIKDAEFILLAATKTHFFLPGGHVKYLESAKSALKREISEEMGIEQVEVKNYLGLFETIWDDNGKPVQEFSIIFEISSNQFCMNNKIISKESHLQFHWIKFTELEKINLLPKSIDKFLAKYEESKKASFDSSIN